MKPVLNDVEVLTGIIENNTKIFSKFYADTKFSFNYFTNQRLGDWHESEIIVDNVFVKLWKMPVAEKKEKFDNILALKKYLYTSCANAVTDRFRVKKKILPVGDMDALVGNVTEQSPEEMMERQVTIAELLSKLYNEIDQLTPDRKKIFQLYLKGLNTAQIAAEMGMSVVAVRNAKFKGLKVLRDKFLTGEFVLLLSIITLTDKGNNHTVAQGMDPKGNRTILAATDDARPRILPDIESKTRIRH